MSLPPHPNALTPFPQLVDEPDPWRWPALPFDWRHDEPPDATHEQPCTIATPTGAVVEGWMSGIDMAAGVLQFRSSEEAPPLALPFARCRRLTLSLPLSALAPRPGRAPQRVPLGPQERELRVFDAQGHSAFIGRTVGTVDAPEGLYLFTPDPAGLTVLREFVPRWACARVEQGRSALDHAAERWIATPEALTQALAQQGRLRVRPIGHALLELGLVTPEQLQRALHDKPEAAALGEMLVEQGVISFADLQTAIAYKMGFPVVDLTRFPIDPAAVRKLPLRKGIENRALPIMFDGASLVVAMDRPARAAKLREMYALRDITMHPVVACRSHVLMALLRLAEQETWSDSLWVRPEFFPTTR